MEVYFLRHGESWFNTKELINEDPSVEKGLTWKGRRQARRVGRKLAKVGFDCMVVSPFPRTMETADIINKYLGIPMALEPMVGEVRLGLDGKGVEVHRILAHRNLFHFKMPGRGKENWQDVKVRMKKFIDSVEGYERVLVVTHQWVAEIGYQVLEGLSDRDAHDIKLGNCHYLVSGK